MLKKFLHIAAAAAFAAILTTVTASAEVQTYVGGYNGIKTSAVEFDPAQSGLKPGGTVTASLKAVKPEGDGVNAVFIAALYDDKKLLDIATDEKTVGNVEVTFTAGVTIPEGAGDSCEIKAMLADADGGLVPLSSPAAYPADERYLRLKDIKADGITLEDFSPDVYSYGYIVQRGTDTYPDIEAFTAEGGVGVDVSIEGEYPGSAVITAAAPSGASAVYTVDFEYLTHAVKGAMKDVDFIDDPGVTDGKMSVADVLSISVGSHENRNKLFTNLHGNDAQNGIPGSRYVVDYSPNTCPYYNISIVPEDLKGCDYFVTKRDNVPTTGDLFGFELGAKAEVVVLAVDKVSNLTDYTESGDGNTTIAMIDYVNGRFVNMFTPYGVVPEYSDALSWQGAANVAKAKPILSEKYGIPVENLNWTSNWAISNIVYKYRYSKVFNAGDTVVIPASVNAPKGYIVVIKVL